MPYGRRPRRNKRKRNKGRKSFGFKVAKINAKSNFGIRKSIVETRNDSVTAAQNLVQFQVVGTAMGTFSDIEKHLIDTITGAPYADQGDAHPWSYATAADGIVNATSTGQFQKWDLTGWSQLFHFRNVDEHPQWVQVYEIVSKTSKCLGATVDTMEKDVITSIVEGFAAYLPGGDATTNTVVNGDHIVEDGYTAGQKQFYTASGVVQPNDSSYFRKHYRIVKSMKYKLNPGDEIFWKMSCPNRVYNPLRWRNDDMSAGSGDAALEVKAGYSKCLLVRLCGVLGRDATAGQHAKIGYLTSDLAYEITERIQVQPLMLQQHQLLHDVAIDDLVTGSVNLAAPTDHLMTDETN